MQWLEKVRNALCMAPAVFNCFLDAADLLACFGCLNWPGPACLLHLESEHSQILELLNRFCSMSGCPWFGWWWTVKQLQQTSRVFDDVCCMHWWNICNSLSLHLRGKKVGFRLNDPMITFKAAPLHEANGKEVCRKQSLLHLMEVNYEKFKEKCRK